jgi:D-glycero-D-manno-heptose 1,7-bisphosphate phosphatase
MTDLVPVQLRPRSTPPPGASAVFLDRDGVLNDVMGDGRTASSPRSVGELRIADAAPDAVAALRAAGYRLIVVTNQPDVARGNLPLADALAMTGSVVDALGLDDAFVCPHDSGDGCGCRKPKPGLLSAASAAWEIDLATSWLIGDRWVDIAAANAAGVRSVLLRRAYSMDPAGGVAADLAASIPDHTGDTLAAAVGAVLGLAA